MLPNCCGRAGRVSTQRHAAYQDAATTKIDPVRSAVEGARSFAQAKGLEDPHHGIDYHRVMTHQGLITDLGHEYDKLPDHDPRAVPHFEALRHEVGEQFHHLTNRMGLKFEATDHDPYKTVQDLAHDVHQNGRIKVLGAHSTGGHPFFSDEDLNKFRAVHDVFGHLSAGRGFDRHGEEAAWQAHSRMFTHHALPAMTTELRGQNGSLIVNGRFNHNKIALLPKRLWHPGLAHEAKVDWEEFRLLDHAQKVRSERAGIGGSKEDRDVYFGLGEQGGRGEEHRVNPKEWMQHSREPGLEDQPAEFQEHYRGYELGRAHGRTGHVNHEELDHAWNRSSHPDHFSQGYQDGLDETLSKVSMWQPSRPRSHEEHARLQAQRDLHETALIGHHIGEEMGARHARDGYNSHEFDQAAVKYGPHVTTVPVQTKYRMMGGEWEDQPRGFYHGYDNSYQSNGGAEKTGSVVAVLVGGMDDMPKGMQVVAHVSGNQIDVLHCPFCGSGAVIARSDGTIECGYCTSIFTVQVQPAYAGFPQSVDGQPYQWPGMPDPNSVMAPDAPPGTNVNPLAQDPMAAGAPPLGDGGLLGVDGGGAPESSDPAEGGFGGDEEGDDDSEGGGNPFAKGKDKSDDKKSDDKKSDKKPPTKKSSVLVSGGVYGTYLLKTASGAQLTADEFEAHLAMKYAQNPLVVAQRIREARAKRLL